MNSHSSNGNSLQRIQKAAQRVGKDQESYAIFINGLPMTQLPKPFIIKTKSNRKPDTKVKNVPKNNWTRLTMGISSLIVTLNLLRPIIILFRATCGLITYLQRSCIGTMERF